MKRAMISHSFFCCMAILVLVPAAVAAPVSFNREVRPILSENCYFCHGFEASNRKADLRLDRREAAIAAQAIVPGNPADSLLIQRIFSTDPDEVMPVPESHRTLTPGQKDLLKRWVAEGAEYEPHWAFIPLPETVEIPPVQRPDWTRQSMDHFVLARLEAEGLQPSPEADRERWLRRVSLDLCGLPPTESERREFLADHSEEAWEKVVDRLLASPHFGEKMAVSWLDAARYADSYGYQSDVDTRAWPWRDWVIQALNRNLPWDQFILWQIAGDLLPEATREQRLATAFHRLHRKTNEGGSIEEEMLQEGVSDRVHTFGTVFLGLTMECCRCHDHKYDPVTTGEYYSMGAFFNSISEAGVMQYATGILPQPALPLPTPEQEQQIAAAADVVHRIQHEAPGLKEIPESGFSSWLASSGSWTAPGQVAWLDFEAWEDGRIPNLADPAAPAQAGGNARESGPSGTAVQLNGDDAVSLPSFGISHANQPVSVSFRIRPRAWERAVLFSNTASADTNYSGYELVWEKGKLRWSFMREFPGNAIAVAARVDWIPGQWEAITATYDGSMKASGLKLYMGGKQLPAEVLADCLTRDIQTGGSILLGARSRDSGMAGGALDEVRIFRRSLTDPEVRWLAGEMNWEESLREAWASPERAKDLKEYYHAAVDPETVEKQEALTAARGKWLEAMAGVPEIPVMQETAVSRPARILQRGAFDAPGAAVSRAVPAVLPPFPQGAPLNRLGLAQWLLDPRHPLTSRVLVNRAWQELMGRGLVATPDNFGLQGEMPSHPALLDWLARDFIRSGWNYKELCRKIVLSATYRQDSRITPELREKDPENRLLARGPVHRLSAEGLRDQALALGGLLERQVGGPPVYPPQPDGSMWKDLNNFLPEYPADSAEGRRRRSLYTFWRRTTTPPNMMALDAPARDVCAVSRSSTNTPLQPLVLMNDPQFSEAAAGLGRRMLLEGGGTGDARLKWLFTEVTGRTPRPAEDLLLQQLYQDQWERYVRQPELVESFLQAWSATPDPCLLPEEWAAAAATASAVLNLDAALVVR